MSRIPRITSDAAMSDVSDLTSTPIVPINLNRTHFRSIWAEENPRSILFSPLPTNNNTPASFLPGMGAFTTPVRRPLGPVGTANNPIDLTRNGPPPLLRSTSTTLATTPEGSDSSTTTEADLQEDLEEVNLEDESEDDSEDEDAYNGIDEIAEDIEADFYALAKSMWFVAHYERAKFQEIAERKEIQLREIEGTLTDLELITARLKNLSKRVLNGQNRKRLENRFEFSDISRPTYHMIDHSDGQ